MCTDILRREDRNGGSGITDLAMPASLRERFLC